jgi:nicotinate-nucleotide pyrophosphorylase
MLPRVETLEVSGGVTLKKITQIGRTAALVIAYSVPPKRTT